MSRDAAEPTQTFLHDLIRAFFPDFLRLVEDGADRSLDFSTLSYPLEERGLSPEERRELGVVAAISTLTGEKATVLVQVVPEVMREKEVTAWLKRWGQALELRLGDPVLLSFVLLAEGIPGVRLATAAVAGISGHDVLRMDYTTWGLRGSRAEYYLERPEPLAWGLSMFMQTSGSRAAHKRACLERIRAAGLPPSHRRLLLGGVAAHLGGEESR